MNMRKIAVALLLVLVTDEVRAADRNEVRAVNIGLQPVFTLMGAALQGKLRTRNDVLRCLGTGMVAGYGFYEAKVNAANGDVRTAWLIANAAASLNANAAAGRHPLSRLRWTVGPLRAEVSTPFERDRNALLHVGVSVYELGALIYMNRESDSMHWRDGMVTFRKRRQYELEGERRQGIAVGIFPGISRVASPGVWEHEIIHTIQSLQVDSVEPPLCAFSPDGCEGRRRRLVQWDFDLGVVPLLYASALATEDYQDRWSEVEAYRLAQDIPPIP